MDLAGFGLRFQNLPGGHGIGYSEPSADKKIVNNQKVARVAQG
jgi:hypothetical protein